MMMMIIIIIIVIVVVVVDDDDDDDDRDDDGDDDGDDDAGMRSTLASDGVTAERRGRACKEDGCRGAWYGCRWWQWARWLQGSASAGTKINKQQQ